MEETVHLLSNRSLALRVDKYMVKEIPSPPIMLLMVHQMLLPV